MMWPFSVSRGTRRCEYGVRRKGVLAAFGDGLVLFSRIHVFKVHMPISIRLDPGTEQRSTRCPHDGRSRAYYIREAIGAHIDDLEDVYLAEKRLESLVSGAQRYFEPEDVARDSAWRIEFERQAAKEWAA